MGFEVIGYNDALDYWKEFFIHPKNAQGIVGNQFDRQYLVQMAQTTSEWMTDEWKAPLLNDKTRIYGLTMKSNDADSSMKLCNAVLKGDCVSKTKERMEFRWPHSPMSIFVELDPNGKNEVDKIVISNSIKGNPAWENVFFTFTPYKL